MSHGIKTLPRIIRYNTEKATPRVAFLLALSPATGLFVAVFLAFFIKLF
jgi:uncharacterized protein involved in exopolysaccharide biosynthesis